MITRIILSKYQNQFKYCISIRHLSIHINNLLMLYVVIVFRQRCKKLINRFLKWLLEIDERTGQVIESQKIADT